MTHSNRGPIVVAAVCLVTAAVLGLGALAEAQLREGASQRIQLAEFKKMHDAGTVVVLDVRSAEAYRAGHIPGALLVPLETVAARAAQWKGETKTVVTYCS